MSNRQYRTLGEGDVRLPGWQVQSCDLPGWVDGNPARDGDVIIYSDLASHEYRVPCSASAPPDGYEVVDRARLPEGARVGATWLRWEQPWTEARWQVLCGGWAVTDAPQAILAAPADELAALYAAGDAERAGIAIGEAFAAEAEKLADSLRQQLAPQGDAEREQPATAPASPCPCCAERDRLAAEVERLRAQIAAARAALEGRDG